MTTQQTDEAMPQKERSGCSPSSPAACSALRSAWPAVPWPEGIWPTTIEQAGKRMRQAMGDADTTAVSGTLLRYGWQLAEEQIKLWLEENGISAPNARISGDDSERG